MFLFRAADGVVGLVSAGEHAPVDLIAGIVANGITAFLTILVMTFGPLLSVLVVRPKVQH